MFDKKLQGVKFIQCKCFLYHWGENTVKGAKRTKVKVLFEGLHMTHGIYVLVHNLKFCIVDTQFKTTC
jgi:hypothetical protein